MPAALATSRSSRTLPAALALLAFLAAWGWLATARAETCPEVPDDEVAMRRSLAKEWFARAEEAEAAGDKQAAVRRYACSLSLAPHPSTAYNLGTVAEKSGDLSMAVDGFRTYLKLAPEATDRPAIEARIATLEDKIVELRKQIAPKPPETPAPAPPGTGVVTTPPPALPAPAPAPDHSGRRIAAWITLGGAVATLATGVAFNLEARSKMDACNKGWAVHDVRALDRCDEAKPFAYGSYALFGAAGALGAVSAVLLISSADGGGAEATSGTTDIGLVPTRGGAAFVASGRF
jgi:hypothetical protein